MDATNDPHDDAAALGERIRTFRSIRDLSLRRLASSAGISPGS